jgi:hypothetical protein
VVPGGFCNGDNLASASIHSGSSAVGRCSLVSRFDGSDLAVTSGNSGNRARFASRCDSRIPSICRCGRAVAGVGNRAGRGRAGRCHSTEGENTDSTFSDRLVVDCGGTRVWLPLDVTV